MKFKSLQKQWYQKLKDEGFEDIEISFQFHSTHFRDKAPKLKSEKEAYYSRATTFLNDFEFDSDREQEIWEMHTEGSTIREIASSLTLSVGTVHSTVARLKDIMMKAIL